MNECMNARLPDCVRSKACTKAQRVSCARLVRVRRIECISRAPHAYTAYLMYEPGASCMRSVFNALAPLLMHAWRVQCMSRTPRACAA
eukprot:364591-Chlamydomonas_euryale.AAC.8